MGARVLFFLIILIMSLLLPIVYGAGTAYYVVSGSGYEITVGSPSETAPLQPGDYDVVGVMGNTPRGTLYLPPARAWLAVGARLSNYKAYVWQGFYFVECPPTGCSNEWVVERAKASLTPGMLFSTPFYVHSVKGGNLGVVLVFAALRPAEYGILWQFYPFWVVDSEKNVTYYPVGGDYQFEQPSLYPNEPVRKRVRYSTLYRGVSYNGELMYLLDLPFDEWPLDAVLVSHRFGQSLRKSMVDDIGIDYERLSELFRIAGHCNSSIPPEDFKNIPYLLEPSTEPRTNEMFFFNVVCDQRGYYPFHTVPLCSGEDSDCYDLDGKALVIEQPSYGTTERWLVVLLKEYDPKLVYARVKSPILYPAEEGVGEQLLPEVNGEQPAEEAYCFVDVRPEVEVLKVDTYPVIHPYDDPYPKRVRVRFVFPSRCVVDGNLYLEYYGLTRLGDSNLFYTYDLPDSPCSDGSCVVEFPVPLTGYPIIEVHAVVNGSEGVLVFRHERSGVCISGETYVGTGSYRVQECYVRCGEGGCDIRDESVRGALLFEGGDTVEGFFSLLRTNLLDMLLFGAMGTAALILNNWPTITELAALMGPVGVAGVLFLEFLLFMFAYGVAVRCTEGRNMGAFTGLSFLVAPFLGGLGTLGVALVMCAFSPKRGG